MTSGVADVTTLYDEAGNPVQVQLVDGQHRLMTHDARTHIALDEIKILLGRVVELLESRSE